MSDLRASLTDPWSLASGLFEHSPVPYAIFDAQGQCRATNAAYRAMFGRAPPPEFSLHKDEEFDRLGLRALIQRAFAGETVTSEAIWYDPTEPAHIAGVNARRVAIALTLFPLAEAGAVNHLVVCYRDVTRERREEERRALAERHLAAVTDNATVASGWGCSSASRSSGPTAARSRSRARLTKGRPSPWRCHSTVATRRPRRASSAHDVRYQPPRHRRGDHRAQHRARPAHQGDRGPHPQG